MPGDFGAKAFVKAFNAGPLVWMIGGGKAPGSHSDDASFLDCPTGTIVWRSTMSVGCDVLDVYVDRN